MPRFSTTKPQPSTGRDHDLDVDLRPEAIAVLVGKSRGKSNKEIAADLHLSVRAVEDRVARLSLVLPETRNTTFCQKYAFQKGYREVVELFMDTDGNNHPVIDPERLAKISSLLLKEIAREQEALVAALVDGKIDSLERRVLFASFRLMAHLAESGLKALEHSEITAHFEAA